MSVLSTIGEVPDVEKPVKISSVRAKVAARPHSALGVRGEGSRGKSCTFVAPPSGALMRSGPDS